MKKSNLIKIISILLISAMVILFTTNVNAADNNGFNDLTGTLTNNGTNSSGNTNNGTNSNAATNNSNSANNATNKNANNSSIYNNTNLPKTGIEDSIPVAMLVVIFGISAVYAYKKIKDYKNV